MKARANYVKFWKANLVSAAAMTLRFMTQPKIIMKSVNVTESTLVQSLFKK